MTKIAGNHTVFHYLVTVIWSFLRNTLTIFASVAVAISGYLIFTTDHQPWSLVFGLPLILVGIGLLANTCWSVILSLFSPLYNRGVCPLCQKSIKE